MMRLLTTWFIFVLLMAVGVAAANEDAEGFAKRTVDRGFAILRGENGNDADRQARFHAFIVEHVDARRSAMFALGPYRRGADAAVIDAYAAAFSEYTIKIYETRLDEYKNATLVVTGSVENKPGDITVNTLGKARNLREPVRIAFRLSGANGSYKITDIQVEGIWLSVELRDEFGALLAVNGGDVAALTRTLVERTSRMGTVTAAPS
jgi:phospholipid transport system substrate-binding protein